MRLSGVITFFVRSAKLITVQNKILIWSNNRYVYLKQKLIIMIAGYDDDTARKKLSYYYGFFNRLSY